MDVDEFWELNAGLDPVNAAQQLHARLSSLPPVEIGSYQEHVDRSIAAAYRWDLWAAAYLIEGGCSDDGFLDFRYGLISRGSSVFNAAIADPESLVDVADDTDAGFIPNERFGSVARVVYGSATKKDMPTCRVVHPSHPIGEDWDFDDEQLCRQNFPSCLESWKQKLGNRSRMTAKDVGS